MERNMSFHDEHKNRRRERRRRVRASTAIFNIRLSDIDFISTYRLTRELFEVLCQEIVPLLPGKRNSKGIDPVTKILLALNFYAQGDVQVEVGPTPDAIMTQQSVSTWLRQVTGALNAPDITAKYIKFPQNLQEREIVKNRFQAKCGIPGIVGCINSTHISIIKPLVNAERFYNGKYYSLNVQYIIDSDLQILNVDASYGGATHEAYVWNHHEAYYHLEELHHQGESALFLGDSSYPLRAYMITPFEEEVIENTPEHRFIMAHKNMMSVVDGTFNMLKGRWRCLLAGKELHYDPETAGKIAIACSVLHNICNTADLEAPLLTVEEALDDKQKQATVKLECPARESETPAFVEGRVVRATIVALFQ